MLITTFTWNMHGSTVVPNVTTSADIFVISLQECDTNVTPTTNYKYTKTSTMFRLKTIVASQVPLRIKFYRMGLGYLGFINKGFIAAVIDDRIVHINAHLSPGEENNDLRLKQLSLILDSVRRDVELIILTGDLNFRCTPNDQGLDFLNIHPSFEEDKITFRPTYKYIVDKYDSSHAPSYCDRVMVASIFKIRFLLYTSLDDVFLSDHKPVLCNFKISNYYYRDKLLPGSQKYFSIRTFVTEAFIELTDHQWIGIILIILFIILAYTRISFLIQKQFSTT